MRSLAAKLLRALLGACAPLAWRFGRRPRLLILMYHRVLPAGHPALADEQPGMYVTPQTLKMHLAVLQRHFTLVHLDDWLRAARDGAALPRNACALTFDDGWRDNFDFAWPELKAARAPATIFLVTDRVGSSYRFWPNRLAALSGAVDAPRLRAALSAKLAALFEAGGVFAATGDGPLAAAAVDRAIAACKSLTDAEAEAEIGALAEALGTAGNTGRDLLDWNEVEALASSGLVRFGSHTRRHCRLTGNVPAAEMRDEIDGSREVLARRLESPAPLFCYPNGDHAPAAVAMVRTCYEAAVTTQRGWNHPRSDRFTLRRVGVHEDIAHDERGFIARLTALV